MNSVPEGCDQRLCEDFEGGAAGVVAEEVGYDNKGQDEVCASGPLGAGPLGPLDTRIAVK